MAVQLHLIEGEVKNLQVWHAVLNLLQSHQGASNAAAGVIGAVAGQHGTAANAAIVAGYEGEAVERFACYVGDRLIEGAFSRVMFRDGDMIKAVVALPNNPSDALSAYAILRPSDGLLSMPYNTGRGVWAELKKNLRWGFSSALFLYIVFGLLNWFSPLEEDDQFGRLLFWIGPAVIGLFFALWSFFAESEGEISTAIFRALDFPSPKFLNLKPSSICPNEGYLHEHSIFRYRRVIKAKDDPYGSPEPEPLKRFDQALAERERERVRGGR